MGKKIVLVFLLVYYLFTSGFVFESSGTRALERMDIPYSVAFSNYRARIVGVYNDDDLDCAWWLYDYMLKTEYAGNDDWILVDYCGASLILGTSGMGRLLYVAPEDKDRYYILLTTWNVENQMYVQGWFEGTRSYEPLPDLSNARLIYKKGKAEIYEVKK